MTIPENDAQPLPRHASSRGSDSSGVHAVDASLTVSPQFRLVMADDDTVTEGSELRPLVLERETELRELGLGRNDVVGVPADKSLRMYVDVLAIHSLGATYVMLDPAAPLEYVRSLLENCDPYTVLRPEAFPADVRREVVDRYHAPKQRRPRVAGCHIACISYTSGSTGTPKGVEIPACAIYRLIGADSAVAARVDDTVLQLATPVFDAFTYEFWSAAHSGATLLVTNTARRFDIRDLVAVLSDHSPTVSFITTSLLHALIDADVRELNTFRLLIFGGEQCDSRRINALRSWFGGALVNVYGPTETTVYATTHNVVRADSGRTEIPIGRPLPWVELFLDGGDGSLRECHPADSGELVIGGAGVGLGYRAAADADAARFFMHPDRNLRLYRTGDLVDVDDRGDLFFVGRTDNQVKRRGFRVELDQLARVLRKHPMVADAAVAAVPGEQRGTVTDIVAFVQPTLSSDDRRIAAWSGMYEDLYGTIESVDGVSQYVGWNDRDAQSELPVEDMEQWRVTTLSRIERIVGDSVLELGVGTGMLMRGVLPHAKRFVGTDLSQQAVDLLLNDPATHDTACEVELSASDALEFLTGRDELFDTIIMNSVVQYFPSRTYLDDLLELCARHLHPGGRIFIGDVILGNSVGSQHVSPQELHIESRYFAEAAKTIAGLTGCLLEMKEFAASNTLSKHRYDVTLTSRPLRAPDAGHFTETISPGGALSAAAAMSSPASLAGGRASAGLNPASALYRLHGAGSHVCAVFWTADRRDLTCVRAPAEQGVEGLIALQADLPLHDVEHELVLEPTQDQFDGLERRTIRTHLTAQLPHYYQPDDIVIVDSLPLTANGKVDTRSLLAARVGGPGVRRQRPQRNVGWRVWTTLQIAAAATGISPDDIDPEGFSIGRDGGSLAVAKFVGLVRKLCGVDLSIHDVYGADTLPGLASVVFHSDPWQDSGSPSVAVDLRGATPVVTAGDAGEHEEVARALSAKLVGDQRETGTAAGVLDVVGEAIDVCGRSEYALRLAEVDVAPAASAQQTWRASDDIRVAWTGEDVAGPDEKNFLAFISDTIWADSMAPAERPWIALLT